MIKKDHTIVILELIEDNKVCQMQKKVTRLSGKERRKQIKKCILEIVSKEGIHKLTTRYLAEKVGVSEGTLFRHFSSKNEMLEEIINDVNNELIRKLELISLEKIPPSERLDKFICLTIKYLHRKKGITLILFTEASYKNDEGLKKIMYNIYHKQKEFFSKIIKDGVSENYWEKNTDIESLANLYMGIPVTLNIETILHASKFDCSKFCEQMKSFILKILQK